jgi:Fem-1 family protein b
MDDFDTLLLSIVHKGDVTALKTQLLTVSNPDVYLNRIYNEPNEQKCTLLMIACLNEYEDMVYMLLDCFKPDLEVLNAIRINDDDKMSELYLDVTILWVAAVMNYSLIVNRLVLHGANINHKTSTNSTPLRGACFNGNVEMVRYLIENGANINVANIDNSTNLILSVYRKHLQLTAYLVDVLGLDVNECDSDGCSPLYFAIKCGSLEIARFLLNRGARNFPPTYDQLSPIMLAAENRRSDLVDIISMHCSNVEWIEAEELLGSAFACAEYGDCDLQQTFEHFCRALELRSIHNIPKTLRSATLEIFNNRQECQTIDQLKEIRLNSDNMHIEAFLVRERLLGPTSENYRDSIDYRGAVLADNAQYDRAVALWLYNLELHQQYSLTIDRICLRQFSSIFAQIFYESLPISIDAVLTVITAVVADLKHNLKEFDNNLHTVLFLTTIVSQVVLLLKNYFVSYQFLIQSSIDVFFSDTDRRIFYQLLYSIHKDRYVTRNDGSSLLHLCLSDDTSASDHWIDCTCK